MELALENPLASFEDQQYDDVSALFANESDHMPCLLSFKSSDLRFSIRSHAAQLCYGLDPFVVYLSVNYIDRFLSKQEILEKKPWIARILVVATLSLASKMSNCNIANSISDLQERWLDCLRAMKEMLANGNESNLHASASCTLTPVSIIDFQRTISESNNTST
ncbi:putative cyclin-D6-1 [Olea europaea var. sylvestris]|uniref:putative cyclin-D6-1 n=1 Tax=Olea europaea var. sylvestris TaxID=158386 RepID=UPI000C1CFD75|nr:putative cyclin-D6-1 [Olea europaea var. sylvestris]